MGRMAILLIRSQCGCTLLIQEKFFNILLPGSLRFPGGSSSKESVCNAGDTGDAGLILGVRKLPWRKKQQPTPVFLPGEFHGQRSLVGYSPWGHKESDMTEHAHTLPGSSEILIYLEWVTAWESRFL